MPRKAKTRKTAYWLIKSEPDEFSIQDFKKAGLTPWDGIRNFQARNYLRDQVKKGDGILFYHSSTSPRGVAGIGEVIREGYPDETAFDPLSPYFDPKSTPSKPVWFQVDLKFQGTFKRILPLSLLKKTRGLEDMVLFRNGRLSVQPVTAGEWKIILGLDAQNETGS